MRWRPTTADRTGACFPKAKRDRPSATSRACANTSLPPRASRRRASPSPRRRRLCRASTQHATINNLSSHSHTKSRANLSEFRAHSEAQQIGATLFGEAEAASREALLEGQREFEAAAGDERDAAGDQFG